MDLVLASFDLDHSKQWFSSWQKFWIFSFHVDELSIRGLWGITAQTVLSQNLWEGWRADFLVLEGPFYHPHKSRIPGGANPSPVKSILGPEILAPAIICPRNAQTISRSKSRRQHTSYIQHKLAQRVWNTHFLLGISLVESCDITILRRADFENIPHSERKIVVKSRIPSTYSPYSAALWIASLASCGLGWQILMFARQVFSSLWWDWLAQ